MSHTRNDWERQLKQAGHRVTRQRSVVLDAVCQGAGHTTLDDVLWRVSQIDTSIDRTTVARTLSMFAEVGIIVASDVGGTKTIYELIGPDRHHHLVCRICGIEQDISDADIAPLVHSLKTRYGFRLDHAHAVLFGTCRTCQPSSSESSAS